MSQHGGNPERDTDPHCPRAADDAHTGVTAAALTEDVVVLTGDPRDMVTAAQPAIIRTVLI